MLCPRTADPAGEHPISMASDRCVVPEELAWGAAELEPELLDAGYSMPD